MKIKKTSLMLSLIFVFSSCGPPVHTPPISQQVPIREKELCPPPQMQQKIHRLLTHWHWPNSHFVAVIARAYLVQQQKIYPSCLEN